MHSKLPKRKIGLVFEQIFNLMCPDEIRSIKLILEAIDTCGTSSRCI